MNTAPESRPIRRVPPHLVVAFCGKSGSGKTTLANAVESILNAEAGLYPHKFSLARPIKLALHPLEKSSPAFRVVAQKVGDLCRSVNEDCFVDLLRKRIESHPTPCVALIDDCRTVAELRARRINEGQIADIVFRLLTKRENTLTAEQRSHISETEWAYMYCTESFITDYPEEIYPIALRMVAVIRAFWDVSEEI